MTGRSSACERCLRRAWLVGELAPFIERSSQRGAGRRSPELLALPDADLLAVVAPTRGAALAEANANFPADELRSRVAAAGCWSICAHSAGWPGGLRDAGDAPAALFGKGDPAVVAGLEPEAAVTVVGARKATAYGRGVARSLGRDLALAGLAVVSGLAYGIDVEAHKGALDLGVTIAVLGCGPDVIYPRSHSKVYAQIAAGAGAVLSELPPGTAAWRWAFPARNRIMAALSATTVVVEAAERSGSLITTDLAAQLGRDVGAVPGPVTSSVSAGTNALLADGARVIRDAADVLEAMVGAGARAAPEDRLKPQTRAVLDALAAGSSDPDAIAQASGLDAETAAEELLQLELIGLVEVDAAGAYRRSG